MNWRPPIPTLVSPPRGYIEHEPAFDSIVISDRHEDTGTHLGHEVGIDHEVVPRKPAEDRSLKMLGQGALESKALEKPIVHIDALRDMSKCFPLSHASQEISPVVIKSCAVA